MNREAQLNKWIEQGNHRDRLNKAERETRIEDRARAEAEKLIVGNPAYARNHEWGLETRDGLHSYYRAAATLEHFLGDIKGKRILHAACRVGTFVHALNHEYGAQAHGSDANREYIQAGTNAGIANLHHSDARDIDAYGKPFDAIYTQNFIYTDYTAPSYNEEMLESAHKNLAPKGLLVFDWADSWHIADFIAHEGKTMAIGQTRWRVKFAHDDKYASLVVLQKMAAQRKGAAAKAIK